MTSKAQNIAVGLTMMVALGLLAVMILLFAGTPDALKGGYEITVRTETSGGINEGDEVRLSGMRVGTVKEVAFLDGDPRKGVEVRAHIDRGVRIPSNVRAEISHGLMGGTAMDLTFQGPSSPGQGEFLATDGSAQVRGLSRGDPFTSFQPALDNLNKLTTNVNELLGEMPAGGDAPTTAGTATATTSTTPATLPASGTVRGTLVRLDRTLESMNAVMGDSDNQRNIKLTLQDLQKFMASANETVGIIREVAVESRTAAAETTVTIRNVNKATTRASDNFDAITQKLIKDAEDISAVMISLNKAIIKIERGEGTTGKLINDPKLYNNLVDMTDQLSALMKDFRELMQQWKDRGVGIKLK